MVRACAISCYFCVHASPPAPPLNASLRRICCCCPRCVAAFRYGGVYVDLDTVFLRDWRPILVDPSHASFSFRRGFNIFMSAAVLRMQPRPNALSMDAIVKLIAEVGCGGCLRGWEAQGARKSQD